MHFDGKMTFSDEPPGTSQIPYRPAQRVRLKGKQSSWGPATLLCFYFGKRESVPVFQAEILWNDNPPLDLKPDLYGLFS